jgi:hypothetical protein
MLEQAKIRLEEANKEAENHAKFLSDLRERYRDAIREAADAREAQAQQIEEQVRTPLEIYKKKIEELKKLRAEGNISPQTFERAQVQFKQEFEMAVDVEQSKPMNSNEEGELKELNAKMAKLVENSDKQLKKEPIVIDGANL